MVKALPSSHLCVFVLLSPSSCCCCCCCISGGVGLGLSPPSHSMADSEDEYSSALGLGELAGLTVSNEADPSNYDVSGAVFLHRTCRPCMLSVYDVRMVGVCLTTQQVGRTFLQHMFTLPTFIIIQCVLVCSVTPSATQC